jgi:hypothetical protein
VLVDATKYRRVILCLRYLLYTRPDLSYSVGIASRYMKKPTMLHQKAVKQILIYFVGNCELWLGVYSEEERGGAG